MLRSIKNHISFKHAAGVIRGLLLVGANLPPRPFSSEHAKPQARRSEGPKDLAELQKLVNEQLEEQSKQIPHANLPERSVPQTSLARAFQMGKVGANLLFDNSINYVSSKLGRSQRTVLSASSAQYLADELCKMRGAPLKLAQVLSIQEDALVSPQVRLAFQAARSRAYRMPESELVYMLTKQLGADWKSRFSHFQLQPFAAASIGQVHYAKVGDRQVAVKVQYRGVKDSIENDFKTLTRLLVSTNLLPKRMFADKLFKSTLRELLQECDYLKEANLQEGYRKQLAPFREYVVPKVISELSTERVLVSELVRGRSMQEAEGLSQFDRDRVGTLMLRLTLLQIFKLEAMQSDPNPSNFIYDKRGRLVCMDFGATHRYPPAFKQAYSSLVKAGIKRDHEAVLSLSKEVGFLTGQEDQVMRQTHKNSIFLLGQPFRSQSYDFGSQDITRQVYANIPVMLARRKRPPPEQIYSLHRKFSGAILQCMRLRSRVPGKALMASLE